MFLYCVGVSFRYLGLFIRQDDKNMQIYVYISPQQSNMWYMILKPNVNIKKIYSIVFKESKYAAYLLFYV